MRYVVIILILIAFTAVAGIWIGASADKSLQSVQQKGDGIGVQIAHVASATTSGRFDGTGTAIIDQGTNTLPVPFIMYTTGKNGRQGVVTKRLVFPSEYVCYAGDVPCATPEIHALPVRAGERIRVIGTIRNDTILVEQLEILP